MVKFINREEELNFLNERFDGKRAEFIVIYGRRRIGKTELVKQFIKDKKHFYFLAKKQNLDLELARFSERFGKKFDIFIREKDWEGLFERIRDFAGKEKRFIIVIDEFSYWLEEDNKIASTLQLIWDEILKETNCFLILSGSLIGMMESIFSYKNPLYGRRTGQFKLTRLDFFSIHEFFPSYAPEELIKVYACAGGIPHYLSEFDPGLNVDENIRESFLRRGNLLYEDAERILKDELREPIVYLNIMECINEGSTTMSEISEKAKVNITNVSKYLRVLTSMGLIHREFSVETIERKARNGIYRVIDNYFRFWLRFVYPYKEEIELGIYDFNPLKPAFNSYLGTIFEDIAMQLLIKNRGNMPFPFTRIGRWWHKEQEIDLVALGDKEIGFFEVKWSDLKLRDARKILRDLQDKSGSVTWRNQERKEHYGIIAKKINGKKRLRGEGYLCYDCRDMKKAE